VRLQTIHLVSSRTEFSNKSQPPKPLGTSRFSYAPENLLHGEKHHLRLRLFDVVIEVLLKVFCLKIKNTQRKHQFDVFSLPSTRLEALSICLKIQLMQKQHLNNININIKS
jgi:hypothetical protein